ncbi:MAG TPA: hypothetical protein VJS13_03990 [Pyrinomonadaceae bacterium]|nr:hypothetical protein [Pyrinomonadaceae bacterium]
MKRLLILTAVLLLAVGFANAQEPSLKPSISTPKAEAPATLSLEVDFNNSLPPSYISVRGADTKPRWIWAARFARIPNAQPDRDPLPVQAIRVESQFNGETADVKISLLRGRNGFEREDQVATYHVGLDEKITVKELKSFGLEPIDLTLLNTVPPLPPAPDFENHTMSVAIASVVSDNVPLPTYKLTFRNQTSKNIRALDLEVVSDGRPRTAHLWQNEFDRPIIESGALAEKIVPAVVPQKTVTAYTPGTATNNTIIVHTVVFDDLTYDGDVQPACRYEAFVVGRRLWLKRVLPLIESELTNEALSPKEFKEKFLSLTYRLEDSEKTVKSVVSSKCENPDSFVDISTQTLKIELVRELDRLINTRPSPPVNFRTWLEAHRENYKAWLARL